MTTTAMASLETAARDLAGRDIPVTDLASYQHAGEVRGLVKQYLRRVAEVLDPIIRAAFAAHKVAVEQKKKLEAPALEVERALKGRMEAWDQAERERLRTEQARAAAAAREEAQAAAFLAAEQRGDEAAMPAIAADLPASVAVFTPPPPPAPRAEGIYYRVTWTAEVTDLMALVQAVALGQAPLKVLQADQGVLNGMARALKESLALPGVHSVARRDSHSRLESGG